MRDVTVRQLRAFAAVIDTGSFSDAAKAMHLSQAALSGLVRELEGRIGLRLFDRTTRSVRPSAVGAAFDPMVRRVLASLDEALDGLGNLKALRRGLVRVAAPEPLSCTLVPRLIATFRARHPGVEVRFLDVPIAAVLESLQAGSADIGLGPSGSATRHEAIAAHGLVADPIFVALSQADPLAARQSLTWSDLRARPLINYMPNLGENILAHVPARHHPREILAVNRVNTALAMLNVQPGAVLSPAMAEPLARGFGLAFLPLRRPTVRWRVAVFTRAGHTASPAVESFLAFALQGAP
ncbi:MAG: LysR family transcriptional regulator [Hyphomicrobiaceae bacterium]|nr:LysR family transcriptional regulator [Hyphomicrobiaceae bacterium]